MKHSSVGLLLAGATAFALPAICSAGDWQLRIGPVVENFKHTEITQLGNVKEDGTLYGLSLRLARKVGQYEIEGALSHLTSEVDYRGNATLLPSNTTIPLRTTTDERITEASIRIARWFLATGDRLALYGGIGHRRWDRDVASTTISTGSNLEYQWPFVMLGAKFSVHRSERANFMIDLRLTKPIDPKVDFAFTNRTEAVKLEMGSKLGYRVEAPFSYKITQNGGVEIAPFYERLKLKESKSKPIVALDPTDPVNGVPVTEPDSEGEAFGLNIHWLQEF